MTCLVRYGVEQTSQNMLGTGNTRVTRGIQKTKGTCGVRVRSVGYKHLADLSEL